MDELGLVMRQLSKYAFIASFSLFLASYSHVSFADIVIQSSSDENIKAGTKLPDGSKLRIPDNVTVNLLKTPENETYTLVGPFVGTLEDYKNKKKCKWYKRVLGNCSTGGIKSSDPVGGTRGKDAE